MGKTEFTNDILKKYKGKIKQPRKLSGTASGVALFCELQKGHNKGQITIIDDTDKILEDTEMLDLLKASLDSQPGKEVSWTKYSTAIKAENLDTSFVYNGRMIIITNVSLPTAKDEVKSIRRQRLDPVMSRCVYLPAGLPSAVWQMEAIKMFFTGYANHSRYKLRCFDESNLSDEVKLDIIEWMDENKHKLIEISFRSVAKIVALVNHRPENWKRLARTTMIRQYHEPITQ